MFKKPSNPLLIIFFVSAALRFFNIDFADGKPVFDERGYYVEAARSYLEGRDDPNPQHPPLGKELIAVGILLFGDNPYGWRMPSLVFSLVGIGLVYLLAREMFGKGRGMSDPNDQTRLADSPRLRLVEAGAPAKRDGHPNTPTRLADSPRLRLVEAGAPAKRDADYSEHSDALGYSDYVPIISALLLSVDSMYFIYSRLAVLDMFLTVFILLTMLFLWRTSQRKAETCLAGRQGGKQEVMNLVLLAVSFGLAMATKWTALHLAPVIMVFLWLRYRLGKKLLGVLGVFGVLGGVVYATTYAPYLTRHSTRELAGLQRKMVTVWRNFDQDRVFTPETYFSRHVYSWIVNPVSAYFSEPTTDGKLRLVIGLYNPVILWGGLLWAVWGVRQWNPFRFTLHASRFSLSTLFLLLPILSNYLPWFFVRRVQYSYYFLPSLPLLVILVSSVLERARRVKRDWVAIFLLSAIIMFGYLFPFLTSVPANPRFLNPLSSGPIRIRLFYDETPERLIFSR